MPSPDASQTVFSHASAPWGGRIAVLQRLLLDPVSAVLHRLGRHHLTQGRRQMVVFAFDHIGHTVNLDGIYERSELEAFMAWMAAAGVRFDDSVVLDIGANIGNHSLFFAPHCRQVLAYEPNPRTFKVLQINAELAPNIECRQKGLSDSSGRARLSQDPLNIGSSSLSVAAAPGAAAAAEVAIVALDDEPDPGPVRLIKMDIEGHELKALQGARALLARCQPIILFEQHPRDFEGGRSAVVELLRECGYSRFATVGKQPKYGGNALARWLLTPLARLLRGETVDVQIQHEVPPGFHFFLVALPDWVKV
jgi:FkbM family methyltransferase